MLHPHAHTVQMAGSHLMQNPFFALKWVSLKLIFPARNLNTTHSSVNQDVLNLLTSLTLQTFHLILKMNDFFAPHQAPWSFPGCFYFFGKSTKNAPSELKMHTYTLSDFLADYLFQYTTSVNSCYFSVTIHICKS